MCKSTSEEVRVKLNEFTDIMKNGILNNSILFMKKAVEQLTLSNDTVISTEGAVLASVYIQLSLELAIKACVLSKEGILAILENKYSNESEGKLLEKLEKNDVRTREFDSLKKHVKGDAEKYKLTKDDIRIIDKFQKYRNKLVHMNYNFSDEELNSIKVDLTYIVTHVIIVLLSDDKGSLPSEFHRVHLSPSQYNKLVQFPLFVSAMNELVKHKYSNALYCPICSSFTLTPTKSTCYCCLWEFDDPKILGFIDCDYCDMSESVFYDRLNIAINANIINGLCLNCRNKVIVYECPKCSSAFNYDFSRNACDCESD